MKLRFKETLKLSPNKGGKIIPKFIILHHSGGSFEGAVDWILNDESDVSYHYLINRNGDLVQFVYDTNRAWHCGESTWKGFHSLNGHSIGIAFSGDTNKRALHREEIESAAIKCLYLMRKFKIGIDAIITHQMIAPERKDDCSSLAMTLVKEQIQKYENG